MARLSRRGFLGAGASALWLSRTQSTNAQEQAGAAPPPKLPGPNPIPEADLAPTLKTRAIPRRPPGPNEIAVDASTLPRDRKGIWVLDFLYKPVRLRTIEIPGEGRRNVYYLWYRVVNRTGQPRMFVPQFTLETDTGRKYEDVVIPQAIPVIQAREDGIPLLGAVAIMGKIPPSTKQGVDDAVFGVALWKDVDPKTDRFQIYVRGLSDGYQVVNETVTVPGPDGPRQETRTQTKYKTLRLDFECPGDEFRISEDRIRPLDPPYEWVYW